MSRKPRPLKRDSNSYRDDRLLLIGCDDTYAPKQYFDAFEFKRVKVEVVPTLNGTSVADHVLDRLLGFECDDDDERWLILDTDHVTKGTHLASLTQTLTRARQARVNIAFSRPCFELWLLLHYVDETGIGNLANATAVNKHLRRSIGTYNKRLLRAEDYQAERVADAIARAERLDAGIANSLIPSVNTTRVYLLWQSILKMAQVDDLPEVLVPIAKKLRGL